jgi:hypothetical protein
MFPDSGTCFKESLRMNRIHQIVASSAAALAIALPLAANASPLYLNAGSMVTSKINQTIDSGSAHAGDRFTMTVTSPYPNSNGVYGNALLYGHVVQAVSAGQGRNAVLTFAVDRLVLANGGGAAGLIAGALYANNTRTNVSLRQGSVVVTEVRQTVALNYPANTASVSHH